MFINHALLPAASNKFNRFTLKLKQYCEAKGSCIVGTRHGTILEIVYAPISKDQEDPHFYSKDFMYCFEANGACVNSSSYDLIELMPERTRESI